MPDGGGLEVTSDLRRFDEAVDWFAKRVVMSAEDAEKLTADAARHAFWVGGGLQLSQVQRVFDKINQAVESGESFGEWRKRVKEELTDKRHAETVFRNATQRALSAGRYRQMREPEILRLRPYGLFDGVQDQRQSPICKACNGVVLPLSDPWWQSHHCPMHHRCRSSIRNIRTAEAKRRGITKTPPDVKALGSFGASPDVEEQWQPDPKKHDSSLLGELKAKEKKARKKREPVQIPVTVPNSPLRENANKIADAIDRGDHAAARNLLRESIEGTLPGAVSKDISRNLPHRGRYIKISAEDVKKGHGGYHGWDGVIAIGENDAADAARTLRLIGEGALDSDDAFTPRKNGETQREFVKRKEVFDGLKSLNVLIHEELHGFSRTTGPLYRGADAVIEEVGTELTARYVLSRMTPAAAKLGMDGGPYRQFIETVESTVERHTGVVRRDSKPNTELRERMAQAHARAAMKKAGDFSNRHEQLVDFVNELDLTPSQKRDVLADLRKLRATHLPASHQD